MAEPHRWKMPSQRLLKMLDPAGHIDRDNVITSARPSVIVWARPALRDWIADEIRAAGATPLLATAFRHVVWSLRQGAQPAVGLAILEHAALSAINASALTTFRWSGFNRRIVMISKTELDRRDTVVLGVDACVAPHATDHALELVIRRLLPVSNSTVDRLTG